ncbi:NF038130 family PEP-CTERM protein [Spirulina sp. CS-785/01]|uniref:NF038130 family PEP-CTERM protein n=1 Tax=Spirulina sp. CS-785/01 TaxID=3021716 RepID=UPI00232F4874|nr:NF038130 family PEP-CTERM protein [Spirulina sp. CS-785/01]MDB9313582.1 NF038130 family PEP-CTERM protein [Spirulina sp. CS-785/01]
MKGTLKKLLVGTSVAVGMSAISAPAMAASLTNVDMFGDDYKVYGGSDPVGALTDSDRYSHVELNYLNESLADNSTGFTANLGVDEIKVEGITQADWDGDLSDQWIADFEEAYPAIANATYGGVNIGSMISGKLEEAIGRSGDPNVSYMAKNDATGEIEMDLIGHYNIWDAPWMNSYKTNPLFGSVIAQLEAETPLLQISEIAKVTVNGDVQYAYGFSAEETGQVAADAGEGDSSSHTGRYNIALDGTPESESVPEPSVLLGLAAFGGLFAASKRKNA